MKFRFLAIDARGHASTWIPDLVDVDSISENDWNQLTLNEKAIIYALGIRKDGDKTCYDLVLPLIYNDLPVKDRESPLLYWVLEQDIGLYGELDKNHTFIQCMFPLDTPSSTQYQTPYLDGRSGIGISVLNRLLHSQPGKAIFQAMIKKMFLYWGFEFFPFQPPVIIRHTTNIKQGQEDPIYNKASSNHNLLRISRAIQSLELLGFHDIASAFMAALLDATDSFKKLPAKTKGVWKGLAQEYGYKSSSLSSGANPEWEEKAYPLSSASRKPLPYFQEKSHPTSYSSPAPPQTKHQHSSGTDAFNAKWIIGGAAISPLFVFAGLIAACLTGPVGAVIAVTVGLVLAGTASAVGGLASAASHKRNGASFFAKTPVPQSIAAPHTRSLTGTTERTLSLSLHR